MEFSPLQNICEILKKGLQKKVIGNEENMITNPEEFNLCKTRIISSCMSVLTYVKIKGRIPEDREILTVHKNLKNMFGYVLKFIEDYEKLDNFEKLLIKTFYDNLQFDKLNLMDFYESLLSVEFYIKDGLVCYDLDKSHRNRLGSYYTPDDFADACVKITFDNFIEKRNGIKDFSDNPRNIDDIILLLTNIKIIDFSSGDGRLLLATARYFDNYLLKNTNGKGNIIDSLIKNIHAIDVDYIALEISKIELSLLSNNFSIISKIKNNFIQGNPLLSSLNKTEDKQKEKIFGSGFIYHKDLGININADTKYDIILGNPPWEKIRFEEKNFFKRINPKISSFHNKSERVKEIRSLIENNSMIRDYYSEYIKEIEDFRLEAKSKTFKLSSNGELNTYALFTELALKHLNDKGIIGLIVKSALVTSPANRKLFNHLVNSNKVMKVFDFVNSRKIFDIDSRERFAFILLGDSTEKYFSLSMNLKEPNQMFEDKHMQKVNKDILKKINPDTEMLPNTNSSIQMEILISILNKNPMFNEVYPNARFGRIVHLTSHTSNIHKGNGVDLIPIYEGKFIHQYDGKYSSFTEIPVNERYGNKTSSKKTSDQQKEDSNFVPESRFFIEKDKWLEINNRYKEPYSLMWRSLTSATNKRTCIATILPHIPTSQSIQLLQLGNNQDLSLLLALFNSYVFDYLVKIKLNGIDLTQSIIKQIPVPSKEVYATQVSFNGVNLPLQEHIIERVCLMLNNDNRLADFCKNISKRTNMNSMDKKRIKAELDLLIAHAYDLSQNNFEDILHEFKSVITKQELDFFKDNQNLLS